MTQRKQNGYSTFAERCPLPTWMVVEDEPDIYEVLLAMFEIWGIDGVAFVDGTEAVSWIDAVDKNEIPGELPELAILDIRLPTISGPEVGARLRQSKRLGNMAVIMITAYRLTPDEEEQVKARAQADTLLYKPLPAMAELKKLLSQIIEGRGGNKAAVPAKPATVENPKADGKEGKPASPKSASNKRPSSSHKTTPR